MFELSSTWGKGGGEQGVICIGGSF